MNSLFGSFVCVECNIKYKDIQTLNIHMRVVHKESEMDRQQRVLKWISESVENKEPPDHFCTSTCKCKVPLEFKKLKALHIEENLAPDVSIKDEWVLEKPTVNESHEKTSYICSWTDCKKEFETEEAYDNHMENAHSELPPEDKVVLKNTSEMSAALAAILKEGPDIMVLSEKENIEEIMIEAKEDGLKCDKCNYQTKSHRSMKMHIKNSHAALHRNKCDKCDFKTSSQPLLKGHIRTVHREQLIKCGECQKDFKTRMELIIHRKLHKSQYPCKMCNYKSKSERCLKIHINKIHTMTFKCDFCQFKGMSNKSLHMHKQKSHISNSFTNIGSKRDHSMVPKNNTTNENSPPKKYKKPDNLKVVGSENLSKNKNESRISDDEDKKTKQGEKKLNKPTNTTKTNGKIPPKSANISNPMIQRMLAEINKEASDHLIRDVTGDGACGTRCLALHCCHIEDQFPKIRRDINKYIIHHWELLGLSGFYGDFDDKEGVTLNVGGYSKTFHSEIEFQCFLDSEEAGLLWMDQIDLQMAANTYKININVLSVELKVPKWTHISPDARLKDHTCGVCEVIKYKMEISRELMLLHTTNHYKIFVPKQSSLADTLGYAASDEKGQESGQESGQEEQEVDPLELSEVEELKKIVLDLKIENSTLRQKLEGQILSSCNICGERFVFEEDLNDHVQQHNESSESAPWLKQNDKNTRKKQAVQQQSPAKKNM